VKWLAECSAEALGRALRLAAPELGGYPVSVSVPDPAAKRDPLWWSSSTVVGERFLVKFAWSRPAALRLAREIGVLTVLGREPKVTRIVPGGSLFEVVDSIDRDRAGKQLARFLAALHDPATRQRVEGVVGRLTGAHLPPATTGTLRERFGRFARPDQHRTITRWCDWADAVPASPAPAVLVHGDRNGSTIWPRASRCSASTPKRCRLPRAPCRRSGTPATMAEIPSNTDQGDRHAANLLGRRVRTGRQPEGLCHRSRDVRRPGLQGRGRRDAGQLQIPGHETVIEIPAELLKFFPKA
jgi:hypothetical protein